MKETDDRCRLKEATINQKLYSKLRQLLACLIDINKRHQYDTS